PKTRRGARKFYRRRLVGGGVSPVQKCLRRRKESGEASTGSTLEMWCSILSRQREISDANSARSIIALRRRPQGERRDRRLVHRGQSASCYRSQRLSRR